MRPRPSALAPHPAGIPPSLQLSAHQERGDRPEGAVRNLSPSDSSCAGRGGLTRGSEEEFWRSGGFPIARGLECALKFLTGAIASLGICSACPGEAEHQAGQGLSLQGLLRRQRGHGAAGREPPELASHPMRGSYPGVSPSAPQTLPGGTFSLGSPMKSPVRLQRCPRPLPASAQVPFSGLPGHFPNWGGGGMRAAPAPS